MATQSTFYTDGFNDYPKGTHKWMDRFDAFTRANSRFIAGINKKLNGEATYSLSDGTSAIKAYMKIYAGLV